MKGGYHKNLQEGVIARNFEIILRTTKNFGTDEK